MELTPMETESPKRYITTLNIDIKEEQCVKRVNQDNFASPLTFSKNVKFSKHTVAPSEYQAAYDKSLYPRSVFNKDFNNKVDKESHSKEEADTSTDKKKTNKAVSFIKRIFLKSSKEKHNNVSESETNGGNNDLVCDKIDKSTSFIDVILEKSVCSNLEAIARGLEDIENKNRQNKRCLHTKNFAKLPNAVDNKIYLLGERGSGLRARGDVQDFYQLRDEHLNNGTLFEDPEFPANDSSLFFSRRPDRHYEWLRPGEICDDPQLFVEGYSRFDVQQGELGDCWLLAAVANLTLYRRLFFQIVPDDQCFDEKYAGIFHFRFWQYGRWIDVVIDDRLPTYRGQLIYLHSTEENEFWSALLEKAYAKLHGSYEALKGGSTCEAMEDFTGGVTEMYEMNATPPNLFKIIVKAYERGSLMGCSLEIGRICIIYTKMHKSKREGITFYMSGNEITCANKIPLAYSSGYSIILQNKLLPALLNCHKWIAHKEY